MQLGKTYRNNIFSLTRSQNHIFSLQYTRTHTRTQYISLAPWAHFEYIGPETFSQSQGRVFHEVILVFTKKPNKCIIKLMINYIIKDKFIYIYIFIILTTFVFSCICLWASLVAQLVKNPPAVQETWVLPLSPFFKHDTWIAFYN